MTRPWLLPAALLAMAAIPRPLLAEVITPNLPPPPCTGRNCLHPPRGATVPHQTGTSAQRCPPGTLFVAKTGTCKVYAN